MTGQDESEFYRSWLGRQSVVAGLTQDLLKDYSDKPQEDVVQQKLAKLKVDSKPRVDTVALLLEHVAYPLKLKQELVQEFLVELPEGKIRQSGTLLAVLQLAKKVSKEPESLAMCGMMIESWILDVCLKNAETISDLEESCLRLLCSLSAGLQVEVAPNTLQGVNVRSLEGWREADEVGIALLPGGAGSIPRSSCLNLALLRKLIVHSEGNAKKIATKKIEELLKEVAAHERHNDSTLATRYALLSEEYAQKELEKLSGPAEWPDMKLEDIYSIAHSSPATMLKDIGKVRWMLMQYARVLTQQPTDEEKHALMVKKVDGLLQTPH